MNELITYTYATSINDRIEAWQTLLEPEEQQKTYKKWLSRKSILKPETYQEMFTYYHWNEEKFSKGILPLTDERAELLLPTVESSDWFSLHKELFLLDVPIQKSDLTSGVRFHIAYYENYLRQLLAEHKIIQFSEKSIQHVLTQLEAELFFIAQKTLVWDVHQMVEEHQIQAESREAEFDFYIEEFLGDNQRTFLFYGAYPALARLLSTRLQFACDAIKEFIESLKSASDQLKTVFSVSLPMYLTKVSFGKGDSHNQGRTVIQFQVQGKDFMFKYKNLEIGERVNQLFSFLETLNKDLSFYKAQRLLFPTFTIEEKVEYQECQEESEVKAFYERYGQLLAITYWLGSTDLHMENLIACGPYPVIVDVETMLRTETFQTSEKETSENRIKRESILASGLLPQESAAMHGVNVDALSGTKQKMNIKIKNLVNTRSSNISFQSEDAYMEGAQNIPVLNGEEVDYLYYRKEIELGFEKMNRILLTNKHGFINKVTELFENVIIRLIYRDTQNYADVLNYAFHVDCMTDYIEREKVISNLWGDKLMPKELLPSEIEAMLVNDIPIFSANTSETYVYTERNERLNILSENPLKCTINHIQGITTTTIRFSEILLKESLGSLEYSVQKVDIPERNKNVTNPLLSKAADIGDKIMEFLDVDLQSQTLDWLVVTISEEGNNPTISYPDENLYEGSVGVYLFFLYLHYYVPKKEYAELLTIWEHEVFILKDHNTNDQGVFFGIGARLFLAYYAWLLYGEEKYLKYLKQALHRLQQVKYLRGKSENEWIYGTASLLSLLVEIHQHFHDEVSYDLIIFYSNGIDCSEMKDSSFSHGYAGVLYALKKVNSLLKSPEIQLKINWYVKRFINSNEIKEDYNSESWCRGYCGVSRVANQFHIALTRKEKNSYNQNQDSCLCHGTFSKVELDLSEATSLINNPINLVGDELLPPIGLFCGLSGIGYQLLRANDASRVKSILFI